MNYFFVDIIRNNEMHNKKSSLEKKLDQFEIVILSNGKDINDVIKKAYLSLLEKHNYNVTTLINELGMPRQSF